MSTRTVGPTQTYATLTAAEAALPGVFTEAEIIEIWTDVQKSYLESVSFSGYTASSTFTLTVKTKDGHQTATFRAASATMGFTFLASHTHLYRISSKVNNASGIWFRVGNCSAKRVEIINDWNTNSFILNSSSITLENCVVSCVGSQQFGGALQINPPASSYAIRNCNFVAKETSSNRPVVWVDGAGGTAVGSFTNNRVSAWVVSTTGDLVEFSTGVPAGTTWNYNTYGFSDITIGRMFKVASTYYSTIAAFNAATTLDANSLLSTYFDPPVPEPLAVDGLGTGSTATEDIFGTARSGAMDIGPLTFTAADVTAPAFSGGVSGLAVADLATNGDFQGSCNAATDGGSGLRGYKYYCKAGSGSPFAAPDFTVEFTTNAARKIRNQATSLNAILAVGVRAVDVAGNETANTDFLTVTPTSGAQMSVGVMRMRAALGTALMKAEV